MPCAYVECLAEAPLSCTPSGRRRRPGRRRGSSRCTARRRSAARRRPRTCTAAAAGAARRAAGSRWAGTLQNRTVLPGSGSSGTGCPCTAKRRGQRRLPAAPSACVWAPSATCLKKKYVRACGVLAVHESQRSSSSLPQNIPAPGATTLARFASRWAVSPLQSPGPAGMLRIRGYHQGATNAWLPSHLQLSPEASESGGAMQESAPPMVEYQQLIFQPAA